MKAKRYYFEFSVKINSTQFLWSLVSDIDISLETAERWLIDAILERTGVHATVDRIWVSTRNSCLENLMIISYVHGSL